MHLLTKENELLEHPPYFPDLVPSDYYLFRNLKQFLRGNRFLSNEEAITAVDWYFAELPESHYRDGIKYWRIIGISVLKLREIILNKKTYFVPTCKLTVLILIDKLKETVSNKIF